MYNQPPATVHRTRVREALSSSSRSRACAPSSVLLRGRRAETALDGAVAVHGRGQLGSPQGALELLRQRTRLQALVHEARARVALAHDLADRVTEEVPQRLDRFDPLARLQAGQVDDEVAVSGVARDRDAARYFNYPAPHDSLLESTLQ